MGTWAEDSFGNDDACDWLYDLEGTEDLSLIQETIERVFESEEYIEAPDAACAIAAAEVVLAASDRPTDAAKQQEIVVTWIAKVRPKIDDKLRTQTIEALDLIMGEKSELRELWEESDSYDAWLAQINGLRAKFNQ